MLLKSFLRKVYWPLLQVVLGYQVCQVIPAESDNIINYIQPLYGEWGMD